METKTIFSFFWTLILLLSGYFLFFHAPSFLLEMNWASKDSVDFLNTWISSNIAMFSFLWGMFSILGGVMMSKDTEDTYRFYKNKKKIKQTKITDFDNKN